MALFRSLPIADAVFTLDRLPAALAERPRDTISLGWEERVRARARRLTDRGIEFGTAFPRGTVLREGDCFALDQPPLLVVVRELAEAVLVARPTSPQEWALWGYHIGNSHQPLMIAPDGLVCPDDPGMTQVLEYHGIRYVRERRTFTPASQSPGHEAER